MKRRNNSNIPSMEITLPNGTRIVATLNGNVEPGRENCDWAGINVKMVDASGNTRLLCSAEYVEDASEIRVFGSHGRIEQLSIAMESPKPTKARREPESGNARFRLKLA